MCEGQIDPQTYIPYYMACHAPTQSDLDESHVAYSFWKITEGIILGTSGVAMLMLPFLLSGLRHYNREPVLLLGVWYFDLDYIQITYMIWTAMLTSIAPGAAVSIVRSEDKGLPNIAESLTWSAFACLEIAFGCESVEFAVQKWTDERQVMSLRDKPAHIRPFEYKWNPHNIQMIGNATASIVGATV
jgi:hypothetical protein